MNVIQRLRADNAMLRTQVAAYADGFAALRAHLDSSKFKGADLDGERKDWISTEDVRRWLAVIENDVNDPASLAIAGETMRSGRGTAGGDAADHIPAGG